MLLTLESRGDSLRKTITGTLSRSTRLGQHSRQNCGKQKRDALGNGRETATHAMAQQYSSTRDGTNTSEKYNTPDQDTPAENLSLLPHGIWRRTRTTIDFCLPVRVLQFMWIQCRLALRSLLLGR